MSTVANPADTASRGLRVELFLRNRIWVFGPQFLLLSEKEWPVNPTDLGECSPEDPELKRSVTVNTIQLDKDVMTHFIQYFSSWSRLKRSVVGILGFKELLLNLSQKGKSLKMVLAQSGMDENQQRQQLKDEMEKQRFSWTKGSFLWRS